MNASDFVGDAELDTAGDATPSQDAGGGGGELDADPPLDDAGTGDGEVAREPLASDTFTRSRDAGLGDAERGGTWQSFATRSALWVEGGKAIGRLDDGGSSLGAALSQISARDVDVAFTLEFDKLGSGSNGLYLRHHVRQTATSEYRNEMLVKDDARLIYSIRKRVNSVESVLVQLASNGPMAVDTPYRLRFQVIGQGPTRLRSKLWRVVDGEPDRWDLDVMDDAAELQSPGALSFSVYLSSDATNLPTTVRFDDYVVWPGER